jgi:DNA-binding PucR family transcriptional regulator
MDGDGRFRGLIQRYTADPDWLPSVARDITDAIHAQLPDLDPGDLRPATYASSESVLRLLAYMVRNDVPPSEAEPPPAAVEYAREFVRHGVPLDSLLRAYHIGHATFFHRWAAAVHADPHNDGLQARAIELGAAWTFEFVEALSAGLVRQYATERERWVRSAAAVRSHTVDAVLNDEPVDVQAVSARLRYDLERDHLAFVVWHEQPEESSGEGLATLERAGLELAAALSEAKPLLVPRARQLIAGWVAWLRRGDGDGLARLHLDTREFPGVLAACGSQGAGVAGFRRSHHEALNARRIATLTRRRPGAVTCYGDVAVAALASADVEQAREFVLSELGSLAADDDRTVRLAATLQVYLEENLSPRRTAQRLGVHENTITNRIRSAQEQLPHPIEGRTCELQVALRIVRLAQDE